MLIISIKIDDQTKEFVTMKTRDRDSVIAKGKYDSSKKLTFVYVLTGFNNYN